MRELAWQSDQSGAVFFYARRKAGIWMDRVEISDEKSGASATLMIRKKVEISSVDEHSDFHRGAIRVDFKGLPGADRVLAGSAVIMTIYYQIPPSGSSGEKRFVLKKKVRIGRTLSDILAAA
ncbi:hypothetical protein [Luteolibacter luteus]|uniref:Uncharacterized protein n=1 Tax=Luteolibacter luteus TaxID=2728835 RepID=A0A858RH44_9BACT|nr:hypothetical protein [Luteolibacter luteus]QJE96122.1 hypothetical protein HHL09_10105 [Luteolibacter luteus]